MREKEVGVYKITSPDGVTYVGSSANIKNRFSKHIYLLNTGKHHIKSMQAQWLDGRRDFVFEVVEHCDAEKLIERERFWVKQFERVHNVFTSIPEKFVQVDCSNGKRYESFCDAAKDFGVRPSGIKHLVKSQRQGKLGVRFKLASDEWRDVLPHYEQVLRTRIKNGNLKHTEATKAKMRAAKIGFIPPNKGKHHREESKAKIAASQKRVVLFDQSTGITYESAIEASRATGVSRTQVRRLTARGERFLKTETVLPVSQRKTKDGVA